MCGMLKFFLIAINKVTDTLIACVWSTFTKSVAIEGVGKLLLENSDCMCVVNIYKSVAIERVGKLLFDNSDCMCVVNIYKVSAIEGVGKLLFKNSDCMCVVNIYKICSY